jgi:hypothetical protein
MFGLKTDHRPTQRGISSPSRLPRRRPKRKDPFSGGGTEPLLEDLLKDPVTEAIMRCDGVNTATLRTLIVATREGLRSR